MNNVFKIEGLDCANCARELEEEIEKMSIQIREECSRPESGSKRYLFDSVPEDVKRQIDGLPKG